MKLLGKGQTRVCYLLAVAFVAFTPFAANAVPFNFTFTGEIGSITFLNGGSATGDIDIGDSVSGSFTYDGSIVPDGILSADDVISNFSITVDGFSYTAPGTALATLYDNIMPGPSAPVIDYFAAQSGPLIGPNQGGVPPAGAQFSLLTTLNLSIFQAGISPTLADFQQFIADNESGIGTNFIVFAAEPFFSSPRTIARFNLTEVTVSTADPAVPLSAPATLPLMAAGLGLLGFIARRRKG